MSREPLDPDMRWRLRVIVIMLALISPFMLVRAALPGPADRRLIALGLGIALGIAGVWLGLWLKRHPR